MNNLDKQYQELLDKIIKTGVEKKDRTGTGTISIFGHQFRHKMSDGFPLLTTKKMAWKTMVVELLWFLRGDTNIKYLVNRNCNIWNGDAYKNYQKSFKEYWQGKGYEIPSMDTFIDRIKNLEGFAEKHGELGPIYGKQWRSWGGWSEVKFSGEKDDNGYLKPTHIEHDGVDQVQNLINDLKTNPDSRRLMVSAWNVGELNKMVLPPCHYGFQMFTQELPFYQLRQQLRDAIQFTTDTAVTTADLQKLCVEHGLPTRSISLMWNQRSVDTFLGLPFNIASYGLLLEMIAKEVNMIPDELIGNLGDTHLYLNHIEAAKEQIGREPFELPKIKILNAQVDDLAHYELEDIELHNYQCHPAIKAPLSN